MTRMWVLMPVFLTFCLPVTGASASEYLNGPKKELLLSVQQSLYDDGFQQADSLSRVLIGKYPSDPAGYFCSAMTLLGQMFDREQDFDAERFHHLIDTVIIVATEAIDTCAPAEAAWMALYLGHARSYRSLWESRFGSFVRALKLAFDARGEYEAGLAYDSSRYDLYLGLGLYHYWKSAKAGILRRVGMFKNDLERGVQELYVAADSSEISRESARNALIWIRLDRREFDSAIVICREMLEKYPDGKVFLWPLAQAYYEKSNYRDAAETYRLLRERLSVDPGNYYNLVECDYQLYRCYDALGMKEDVREVASLASAYAGKVPAKTGRRQRHKIAFLRRAARF